MSMYRDWEFHGRNNNGSFLSSKQIECLIALDEFDLDGMEWKDYDTLIGSGFTESFGAYERIEKALDEFAFRYPEANMTVFVDCNGEKCGFMLRNGKVQAFTSCTVYLDGEGRELDPMDGL